MPSAAALVATLHISPYLDKLYETISENPSITVQGLSDLFVADYGKFFDVEQLRVATSRLKRRHAIFKNMARRTGQGLWSGSQGWLAILAACEQIF